jgi:hypothetical protein
MRPQRLASLAAYAGDRLHRDGASGPYPCAADIPVRARKAVYVVCAWSGKVLYVGSTVVGVSVRIAQHLRGVKTLDWTTVYVIPLDDDTPVGTVRRIEGRIGVAAGPVRNRALPRITGR